MLRCIALLFLFFALTSRSENHPEIQTYLNMKEFGIEPVEDATPVVVKALKECNNEGIARFVFPKGVYHFYPALAPDKYCAITNNDNGLRHTSFPIWGFNNFEIDGDGSEFLFHGRMVPFILEESNNITIKNLSIKWEMAGLRGRKWYLFEGGIRVPYIIQWKGKITPVVSNDIPVVQLDVLPKAVTAAGGEIKPEWNLDGKNILPLLTGIEDSIKRDALFWHFGAQFAIRKGDWKLVIALETQKEPVLVNLKDDMGETADLSKEYPEIDNEWQQIWNHWNRQMPSPRWVDKRWNRTESYNKK